MTPAELVFVKRMLPHFEAGLSVEAAARAVLDDDIRIMNATSGDDFRAKGARAALVERVYHACRA